MTKATALPPEVFAEIVDLPDRKAGAFLLGWWIAAQAEQNGIPIDDIPEEFAKLVVQRTLAEEAQTAKSAAIEKALHKAASGDFETAGRLIKEHMASGAEALKFIPLGKKSAAQKREFGKRGADEKRKKGQETEARVYKAAKEILEARQRKISSRDLAKKVGEKTGIPEGTARTHIQALRKAKKLD